MSKIKQLLSSPGRIAVFALCVILVVALLAFAGIKVGASVMNNQGIGLDQATKVALQNAGFEESDVTLLRGHFDRDDGISTYDIEFRGSDGFDYDYVISANDGTIIEANRELAELLWGVFQRLRRGHKGGRQRMGSARNRPQLRERTQPNGGRPAALLSRQGHRPAPPFLPRTATPGADARPPAVRLAGVLTPVCNRLTIKYFTKGRLLASKRRPFAV